MKNWLLFLILLIGNLAFAQIDDSPNCEIKIYLLRDNSTTYTDKVMERFFVTKADLEDTAFIDDSEILSYIIKRDTSDIEGITAIKERHWLIVSPEIVERVTDLSIPLCCGRKFALLVDGSIAYTGYFWNYYSSFSSDWITATASGSTIYIDRKLPDYGFDPIETDPRHNSLLLNCLENK